MQIHFSNNNNINKNSGHYLSGTHQRVSSQRKQQPQEQYQLLQHPMIVQSRSTDSQLDVESSILYASQSMKHKENLDQTDTITTSSSLSLNHHKSNVAVSSFFSRTHPSLLNDSSESSSHSSSSSSSVLVKSKEQNMDISSATKPTATLNNSKTGATNVRRRRSQDIFQATRLTAASAISCDNDDDHNDYTDDDDDDQENGNIKRTRWSSDIYDTHSNGFWIQRSYAFDESDDEDHEGIDSDENVAVIANVSFDYPPDWVEEPLAR